MSPSSVSIADAWRLFDRSISSRFTPTATPLEITLDRAEQISLIKVYGPAPYRLDARGRNGAFLGFETIDVSKLAAGWHAFPSSALVSTSFAELRFEAVGRADAVPEIEIWSVDDGGPAAKQDVTAHELASGLVAYPASSKNEDALPGNCATFEVAISRSPSQLRRAHLVYDAQGLFRSWVITRSINGLAEQGGAWIDGDGSARTIADEIDPTTLHAGDNEVSLCVPNVATRPVAIANLRIVGELDRGVHLARTVSIGSDQRDASSLVEPDPATSVEVAAGERVVVALDRLIAPDALVVSGRVGHAAAVECVDQRGGAQSLTVQRHTTSTGVVLALDGQARACAELAVTFETSSTLTELDVVGSGAGEPVDWPRIVVTSAPEHFGDTAWVGGFVARPPVMTGAVRVDIAGRQVDALTGHFGRLIERTQGLASPWPVAVSARLPDGTTQTRQLVLGQDQRSQRAPTSGAASGPTGASVPSSRFGNAGDSIVVRAGVSAPASIRLGSHVGVDVPAGAVARPTDVTLRHLDEHGLPPLDPGMVNVTAPKDHGFEFLPHGQRFAKPVEVVVPYDASLIPEGMTPDDVHTYFYDPAAAQWKPLDRRAIDVAEHITRSTTNHFTIMIDAVLAVPKNPAPLSLDPTALTSIGAASPAANIDLIEPPQANSTGDARMSLPIRVPKGRGAYTPSLGISYSSASGNGWLGVGWDLAVSKVEIDTRWGVPTYAASEEPRYLLDGAELVPTTETEGPSCRDGRPGRRYHTRIEGAFAHILRCDHAPGGLEPAAHYGFEVHDRDGTLFVYGVSSSENPDADARHTALTDPETPHSIFRWYLREVVDVHGNTTTLDYQVDNVGGSQPGREVYPSSISYTAHAALPAAYRVDFLLDDGTRRDRIVSGRAGFKTATRRLLRRVRVTFDGSTIRDYVLSYAHGQFDKTVLASVRVYGTNGCAPNLHACELPACSGQLDEHTFEYAQEDQGLSSAVRWDVAGDPAPDHAALGKGKTGTFTGDLGTSMSFGGVGGSRSLSGSFGGRAELVGTYDLDGDGLADELFARSDGSILALYNQSRPGLAPGSTPLFAATGQSVTGLSSLGVESHGSWGVNASQGIFSVGYSSSSSRARQVLADLNGDGYVDAVRGTGVSLLGRPCATGTCFSDHAFGVTASVDPRTDPLLSSIGAAVQDRNFVGDPVVQWVAPFDGTITVTGVTRKPNAGGADGVTVELYHQDSLLAALPIDPATTSSFAFPAPTTVDVSAGEAIYLRVATGADDGIAPDGTLQDLVTASLDIRYTHACTTAGCSDVLDPLAAHEPAGAPVFAYDSQSDFRLAGTPAPIPVLANGTLHVQALLSKTPSVADLRVCVQRFVSTSVSPTVSLDAPCDSTAADVTNVSGTIALPAESPATVPLDLSIPVEVGQLVIVRIESDLSFDPANVALAPLVSGSPIVAYTEACLPDTAGTALACSSDPAVLESVPLIADQFGPYVRLRDEAPHMPFVAPTTGLLHVDAPLVPLGPYVFAIRSDQQGVIAMFDCTHASCGPLTITPFVVSAGESITFDLVTESGTTGSSTIDVSFDGGTTIAAPLAASALSPAVATTPFSGGYRRWRAAVWNEAQAFEPARLLADFAAPLFVGQARAQQIAESIVPVLPSFAGSSPTGGAPAWMATGSAAFVTSSEQHAAPLGALLGTGPGGAASRGGVFEGGYTRLSGTSAFFFGTQLLQLPGFSFDFTASHSTTETTTDVVDMNGDGVLDSITADRVRLGALDSSDGGLAGHVPGGPFRRREGKEYAIGFGGDKTLVRVTSAGGRTLSVDNGEGPDTGTFGLSGGVGLGIGRSETTTDLVDLNGDGLPDLIRRDGTTIKVRLNLGHRFGVEEVFGQVASELTEPLDAFESVIESLSIPLVDLRSTTDALQHETTITEHASGGFRIGSSDIGFNFSHSERRTSSRISRLVADINGDGLPDLLYKRDGEPEIRVQLNRGGEFGPKIAWTLHDPAGASWPVPLSYQFVEEHFAELHLTGPDVLAGTGSQDSSSNAGHVHIPLFGGLASIDIGGSAATDHDTYELGVMDIDGDGVADQVLRRARSEDPGTVYVKHNLVTGRGNLLRTVHRPLGGTITLEYTRAGNTIDMPHSRQVLALVRVDDGVDLGVDFESPNLMTTISYDDAFYSRGEKEFFGFGKVTTTRADGVSVEDDYENRTFPLHGRLLSETRRDSASHLFHQHRIAYDTLRVVDAASNPLIADPDCTAHLHPLLGTDACLALLPIVLRDEDTRAEGGTAQKTRTIRDTNFDRFGDVLDSTDEIDDAITTDDVFAQAAYQNDTTTWIIGRATSLQVRAGSAAGTLLRSRSGEYDALGELTAVHVETGSGVATTQLAYDTFGNLARVTTPPNEGGVSQTFDVTYDPEVATYPVSIRDAFGYASTAVYDVRFGVATSETDINGAQMTRTLDAFGRLSTVRGPYDTAGAALTMEYHPEEFPPRAVTTTRASAPADYTGPVPTPITMVTMADGFGRAIELRKTSVVDGVSGMTTSGLVSRDTVGRVVRTQNPFFTAGSSTSLVTPQSTLATTMAYDAVDRPVLTTYPDGATESASFAITAAPGGAQLFLSRMVDPNGHARETYLDHGGRTRAFVEHPTAASASVTSYDYLPTGELAHITDAEGNATQLVYDLRGLRTALSNPDDGLIEDRYDLMGNRTALVEPNHRALGTAVHFVFERDRLVTIDYPSKPDVTFAYGPPGAPSFGAGRITRVTDETGTQDHSYGALGEVRRTLRTVSDPGAKHPSTTVFDLHLTTDSLGRQLRIGYPDGEVVTNTYDAGGMLAQVQGAGAGWSRSYADGLRYDVFGNRTRAHDGNGDVSTWTFDPARIRLTSLVTTLASSTRVQDLHYTYDPASNPLAIANTLPPTPVNNTLPGTSSQAFTYDGVDRLVHATGAGTLSSNKTTTFDEAFAYTQSHNIAHKTLQHLVINNGGSTAPNTTNYSSDYVYGGRPHLPTQIGTMAVAYDPSGNPVTRTQGNSVQNLVWDDDGRMVHIQGMGANQRNVFDAAGLRVFRVGGGDVIFANSFFEFDTKKTGTKHVFAGAMKVASVLGGFKSGANPAAPNNQGTAYFFHADHLGSTGVVTTENGSVNDAHQYFPDGDAWIDAGKSGTADGFLFSGKPFDPDTGFYDFGQRFYEPKTSLWLGVDSAFVTSPNSAIGNAPMLGPIGFVAQSPVRLHDADGREIIEYGPLLGLGPLPNPPPDPPCEFCGDLQRASDRVASRWTTASPLISTVHRTAPSVVMTARLVQVAAVCAGSSGVGCGVALALLAADFVPSGNKRPPDASIQTAAAIATGRIPNVPLSSLLATIEDEGAAVPGGGLPQLMGSTVPELAKSAVQTIVRSGGTQAEKAALFEKLVPQIQRAGPFVAGRSTGTEGSAIFIGRLGEALVISPTGQVFRGSLQSGGVVVGSGGLTPVFDALKLVQ